jgi:hypothetical protein
MERNAYWNNLASFFVNRLPKSNEERNAENPEKHGQSSIISTSLVGRIETHAEKEEQQSQNKE